MRDDSIKKNLKIDFKNQYYWRVAVLIFIAHTVIFFAQVPQVYFNNLQSAIPNQWWIPVLRLALGVYFWGLFTPAILWLGWKFPFIRGKFWRNIILHLVLSILLGVIQNYGYTLGIWLLNLSTIDNVKANLFNPALIFNYVPSSMLRYAAVIAIQQAYLYFQALQEREFRLQQRELQALKSQLNPHFLFNTLNAISELVFSSPKDADRTINQLSRLLRKSLKSGKTEEITLKEELNFIESYLQIHQTLMRQRLEVLWEISPETLNAAVPNMILQPLVENAIQHGLTPLASGGTIEIAAERENGHLHLRVKDNGLGLKHSDANADGGIGLDNSRARLRHLYGERQNFEIKEGSNGGVIVDIKIPFREHPEENENEDSSNYS